MKDKNINALMRLSRFCRYSGIVSLGLGFFVVGMDLIKRDFVHMQIGFFIFICGYAFHKIGARISSFLFDERTEI